MKLKRCRHASFIIFILVLIIGVRGLNFRYFDFKISLQQHPFNRTVYKHLFYKLQKLTVEKSVFIDCVEITCIFFFLITCRYLEEWKKNRIKMNFI